MPVPGPGGAQRRLNVSATTCFTSTSVATTGWVFTVCVTTAGSGGPGALYDNNSTSTGNTAANLIGYIPTTVGTYSFAGFPYYTGLVYTPGSGQVVSISYT